MGYYLFGKCLEPPSRTRPDTRRLAVLFVVMQMRRAGPGFLSGCKAGVILIGELPGYLIKAGMFGEPDH